MNTIVLLISLLSLIVMCNVIKPNNRMPAYTKIERVMQCEYNSITQSSYNCTNINE